MATYYCLQRPFERSHLPMTRRPLFAAAALSAALTLTACNGSPEAGRPNTTPPTASPTTAPTPAPSTPAWTEEEQAAITAAQSRYTIARAAIDSAMNAPHKATRGALESAGNGGNWIITVLGDVNFQRENGWYQAGKVQVVSTSVASVTLAGEQPRVGLTVCLDTSKTSTRFLANNKPVPKGPGNGKRHKADAVLVYAPPAGKTAKMWFLIDEKASGSC
jgi:hypothetical protein